MRRSNRLPRLSFGLLVVALGCSSKGGGGTGPGPTPTIALSLGASAGTAVQGGSTQVAATLTRGGGFTGTVDLTVEGAPAGVTATVGNVQTSGAVTTATVTVSVGSAVAAQVYNLTVRGTGSGVAAVTAPFALTVTVAPDYSLSINPGSVSVVQGASSTPIAVTITRTNFTDPVTLALGGTVPAGVSAAFTPPAPAAETASLTVAVGAATVPGSYTLSVDGSGTASNRSTPLVLTVTAAGSFTIGITPAGGVTLQQGGNDASKTVTITRTNYTQPVTLAAEGLPAGLTAAFAPNPAGTNSTVLTLTASGTVAPNTYNLTIRATGPASVRAPGGPASLEATTTLSVTVIPPGSIALGLSPACAVGMSIQQNSLDDSRIIAINRTNFPASVALSVDNLPAGLTATFSGNPTATNSSVMTLATDGTVATGTYTLTIRGTGPGTQASVALPVAVTSGPAPTPNLLDYTFPGGSFQGWAPGGSCATVGAAEWGIAFPQGGGYIGMDGTGSPAVPNGWFSKLISLPVNASTLEFDASGLNDARLHIRILDNGVSSTAFDQIITGAAPSPAFRTRTADISAWAGKAVRVFFEQDDNGFKGTFPGNGEQIYLDNIHFRTTLSGAAWTLRRQVTVSTTAAGTPAGYSVSLTFDHAALVSAGKSLASGDDIRLVYSNGTTLVEQHRVLDPGSSWNSASTTIWFKTLAPIGASGADNNYYVYYGNPAATNPPANRLAVFLFADDFETGTLANWIKIDAQSWAISGAQAHGGTKAVMYPSEAAAGADLVANPALNIADVYLESWWFINALSNQWNISQMVRTRAFSSQPNRKYLTLMCTCLTTSLGWNLSKYLFPTYTDLANPGGTPVANTWTRVGVAMNGSTLRNFVNNVQINVVTGETQIASGNVGLSKYIVPPGASWWVDDVIARKYVNPEPGSAPGAEQGGPFPVSFIRIR